MLGLALQVSFRSRMIPCERALVRSYRPSIIGVGTAGATGALVPALLKPRGRKYLFAPAIICQVYPMT